MAVLEEMLGEELLVEMGLGIGILALGRRLLRPALRPAAKALIKGGLVLYRGAQGVINEASTGPSAGLPSLQEPALRLQAAPAAAGAKPPARRKGPAKRRAGRPKKSA